MSASESPIPQGERDAYIVRRSPSTSAHELAGSIGSTTQTVLNSFKGVRLFAPLLVRAALVAPGIPIGTSRLSSLGQRSRTAVIDVQWALDDWTYTTERGTMAQVEALNALLALPAREGLSLDLPD